MASAKFILPCANLCRGRGRCLSLQHTLLGTCHTPHSDTFLAVAVHKPNCISLARPKGNAGNAQWQLKPCRIICSASAHKYAMVLLCHVARGRKGGVATCLDLWHSANFIMGQARTACDSASALWHRLSLPRPLCTPPAADKTARTFNCKTDNSATTVLGSLPPAPEGGKLLHCVFLFRFPLQLLPHRLHVCCTKGACGMWHQWRGGGEAFPAEAACCSRLP